MTSRATDKGITYVAFTATPKAKTLELFGRRPDPSRKAAEDNLPAPFHVYSMRQAIEEGFIFDVLQNYTTYTLAFKLANAGKEINDKQGRTQHRDEGIDGLGATASIQHRSEGPDEIVNSCHPRMTLFWQVDYGWHHPYSALKKTVNHGFFRAFTQTPPAVRIALGARNGPSCFVTTKNGCSCTRQSAVLPRSGDRGDSKMKHRQHD